MNIPRDIPDSVTAGDHVRGPRDAVVTIIEYGDFECPRCKQAAPAVILLLRRFDGRVRFVYRHFPLEEVHANAFGAAEAAEAAAAQGRFWEMHDALYRSQPHLRLPYLRQLARTAGLDVTRFSAELEEHVYASRVRAHLAEGRRLAVRVTPTFYVNGTLCDVSFSLAQLGRAVERVLAWAPERATTDV